MTDIFIFKSKEKYFGFEIKGHASKDAGDVLCASISLLAINTYNSIERICLLTKEDMNLKIDDGYFKIYIDFSCVKTEFLKDIQTLIKSFETGILSLKKEYNKYLEVYYKEV